MIVLLILMDFILNCVSTLLKCYVLLGLLVLHCNPSLLHCIGKISYQSSLYCGPFVWFVNILFVWAWLVWHCILFFFFFPYFMLLWSLYGYLLFKPSFARIGYNGAWSVATTSPIINNSNNGNDTKVFRSLSLSLALCHDFAWLLFFSFILWVFWNLIICVITLSTKTYFSRSVKLL